MECDNPGCPARNARLLPRSACVGGMLIGEKTLANGTGTPDPHPNNLVNRCF